VPRTVDTATSLADKSAFAASHRRRPVDSMRTHVRLFGRRVENEHSLVPNLWNVWTAIHGRTCVDAPMAQPLAQISPMTAPVPPQNLEAEESVLGAMLLSPGAIGAVSEIVDAGDFYRDSHGAIFRTALALYAKGEPVDAITLI